MAPYSLKSFLNANFFEELVTAILFFLRVFVRNLLRKSRRRNVFHISFCSRCLKWVWTVALCLQANTLPTRLWRLWQSNIITQKYFLLSLKMIFYIYFLYFSFSLLQQLIMKNYLQFGNVIYRIIRLAISYHILQVHTLNIGDIWHKRCFKSISS